MEKDIIEETEIISVFDGWRLAKNVQHKTNGNTYVKTFNGGAKYATVDMLKYHTSWNWLHSAWSKCFKRLIEINTTSSWGFIDEMRVALIQSDIKSAFEILVRAIKFITWYTTSTTPTKD